MEQVTKFQSHQQCFYPFFFYFEEMVVIICQAKTGLCSKDDAESARHLEGEKLDLLEAQKFVSNPEGFFLSTQSLMHQVNYFIIYPH